MARREGGQRGAVERNANTPAGLVVIDAAVKGLPAARADGFVAVRLRHPSTIRDT